MNKHKENCNCVCCKSKRGEYKGVNHPRYGKISPHKNKTYEEIVSNVKAKRWKIKKSISSKGKISNKKNKTYEEIYGKERAIMEKEKRGKNKTYEEIYGNEIAKKLKLIRKQSLKNKTFEQIYGNEKAILMKENLRIVRQNQILEMGGGPNHGEHEDFILDELEKLYGYKIIRQYPIKGHFLDGYIPELNLAIEIDEKGHYDNNEKLREKDIIRQKEIEKELGCKFLRVEDRYD